VIDWPGILRRGFESKELEYKGPIAWDEGDKKACCELVKDVIAIANSGGGWVLIGLRESATGFIPEGLSPEQAKSFETTRLNNFVNNYAEPPINTYVQKLEHDAKLFVVIEVPGFPDTPHICQKDYPQALTAPTLYVRTDNNESAPIRSSKDFRAVVERAVRNRSDQLLSSFRAVLVHGNIGAPASDLDQFETQIEFASKRCDELNPHRDKTYGYRVTSFFPARFDASRFDIPILRAMAKNGSVDFRGWPFIFFSEHRPNGAYVHEDALETFLPDHDPFTGGDDLHYWRLEPSGLLHARQLLREDSWRSAKGGERYLDFDRLSCEAAEAIVCLTRLYEGTLEASDEVTLRFSLTDMNGRGLDSSNRARLMHPEMWISHTETARFGSTHTLADWRAGLVDHALALCRYVFVRFDWQNPNLGESKKLIENMLSRRA
jgi:hypothetical protein